MNRMPNTLSGATQDFVKRVARPGEELLSILRCENPGKALDSAIEPVQVGRITGSWLDSYLLPGSHCLWEDDVRLLGLRFPRKRHFAWNLVKNVCQVNRNVTDSPACLFLGLAFLAHEYIFPEDLGLSGPDQALFDRSVFEMDLAARTDPADAAAVGKLKGAINLDYSQPFGPHGVFRIYAEEAEKLGFPRFQKLLRKLAA